MSDMTWVPVANASDLAPRHVFQGRLLGQELAIWRADDGNVNVWENRCLHRGVRLSIGVNTGSELVCQYHGWRYANRNAGCTYIPAHPADAPPHTICNRTWPALEQDGLIWTHFAPVDPPRPESLGAGALALRPQPVAAAPELARAVLAGLSPEGFGPLGQDLVASGPAGRLRLMVQAADAGRAVLRGLVLSDEAPLPLLRRLSLVLRLARDEIERRAATLPVPAPIPHRSERVAPELAEMPEMVSGPARIRVRVAKKQIVGEDIVALELAGLRGTLPASQPGAHIDVALPNGLLRQYSLVNAPGETDRYVIGIKREAQSTGGSAAIHDSLAEGDLLAISEPRNNFTLRRDAEETVLIAGGIGVTPLLSMAAALRDEGLPFTLHYFAASAETLAFGERLALLGERMVPYLGLDAAQTTLALQGILKGPGADRQVYVCGPAPMLDAARATAAEAGWPEAAVHFEYFANTREIDTSSSFRIELARSALSLEVPAGRSILSVLQEAGVAPPSSCSQGACGTCMVRLLEGEPDHQDVYLTGAEKAAGEKILTCVSRAKSDRLILDL
ncbi:Rieske 2Fe-2S domain-containing protein [Oceanicola sp. S124]|uniref:Rieske 2Fe-2S domain-containing protein n=1 Tax=Oceanicola sp. S124 TaxID=1042378 RepID=UPI000255974B|nr:Rieske 2Fe-2S domain-containing protein [Oceanicola sp. S124]